MLDRAILEFDKSLRTLFAPATSVRPVPGEMLPETRLDES